MMRSLLNDSAPLVLYMVGGASSGAGFALNDTETLSYENLASSIQALEEGVGIRHLVLIADTDDGSVATGRTSSASENAPSTASLGRALNSR